MKDESGDHGEVGFLGDSSYFDKLESVEGEAGNPGFAIGIAFTDVGIGGTGCAEVFGHEATVGVEHFAVANRDFLSGFAFDLEADVACDVLSEVEDEDAGRLLGDSLRGQFFSNANGLRGV